MTLKYGSDAISIVTGIKREGFEMRVLENLRHMKNSLVPNVFAVMKVHESETKDKVFKRIIRIVL